MLRRWIGSGMVLAAALAAAEPTNGVAPGATQDAVRANSPATYAEPTQLFAARFPEEHLSGAPVDDVISRRAWTNFLNDLDGEHLYFTPEDMQHFRLSATNLDDEVKSGDISFAFDAYERLKERIRERVTYVETQLKGGLTLTDDEVFQWKRRKTPWPADTAARDDLWRRKLENEYIQRIIATESAPATNAPPKAKDAAAPNEDGVAASPALSPEDFILKRYRQFLSTIVDNDGEWVAQTYLSAFAQAYDPHSAYMSQSANEDFDIEMRLSLVGIGAMLRAEDGAAKVMELIPGGPAHRDTRDSRLRPGDKIIGVGQDKGPIEDTLHWPLYKVVRKIRGKQGSTVVLQVIPASDPSGATLKTVDLVRDEVKLEEQAAKSTVRDVPLADGRTRKLGVIRVPAFYANMQPGLLAQLSDVRRCSTDVQKLLEEQKAAGVEGVVLDLRGNGGGSLVEAINMTGLFIPAGPVVQVREGRRLRILPDMDGDVAYAGPLVVLVNRFSASASEILAAALQDYGRALIVGDSRTHGKGTVQTITQLGRDKGVGSIKVTCSMFYRINGDSTQKHGVTPDLSIPSALDYMEVGEDNLPNAMEWSHIRPAVYMPSGELARWRPELAERSNARRAADPRYAAYLKLLDRVRQLNENETVPLQLERRRAMAKDEKALEDLQADLAPEDSEEAGGGEPKEKRPDVVLDETLQILSDMVTFNQAQTPEPAAQPQSSTGATGPKAMASELMDWLRGVP